MKRTYCDVCKAEVPYDKHCNPQKWQQYYCLPDDINDMCSECCKQFNTAMDYLDEKARKEVAAWIVRRRGGEG